MSHTNKPSQAKQNYVLPGADFVTSWVSADGYDLMYAAAGSGPVLISLPGSAGIEMSVGKDLLAKHFRVIEINPPGWGPRDDFPGRIDQKDLAQLLAKAIEALGIEHYHLIGNSMGGVNALWLALHYPERVRSLILDASMTFMGTEHSRQPETDEMVKALRAGLVPREKIEALLANLPPGPQYPAKPWMDQEYFRMLTTYRTRMMPHVTSDYEDELNERANEVHCPVLGLLGDADEILKPSIEANYRKYMPAARFQLIPGGSHDLQGSHPQEYAAAVQGFVEAAEASVAA